ncbi:MAG: hypothetical protein VCB81_06325, partial [Verrucomicrobiia bacterium]
VHNLRVATVEMDNFAQELAAKIESEYLQDVPVNALEPLKTMAAEPEIRVEPKPQPQPEPAAADETKVEFDDADDVQPDLLPPETEAQS